MLSLKRTDFDSLHNICTGKHFYQFYKGLEDYLHVMVSYFQAGLEKGQACLWLFSERIGVKEVHYAASFIPGFETYLAKGQLEILPGEDWYLTNGAFDEEKAMANAANYLGKTQKQAQILVSKRS